MKKTQKKSPFLIQVIVAAVLVASGLMIVQRYVASKTTYQQAVPSESTEPVENKVVGMFQPTPAPHSPFKQKALVRETQNGNTTERTTISKREVIFTEGDERQYYGDHPEYHGWNAAYAIEELYRYPDPWGYHSFWDLLLSDNSGDTTRTVVSLSVGVLPKVYDTKYNAPYLIDNSILLDAEIGFVKPNSNTTLQLVKVEEFITVDGRKVAKFRKELSDGIVNVEYIIDRPDESSRVTIVSGNPMNSDVAEKEEATLDQVVRSFTYVPYEYR